MKLQRSREVPTNEHECSEKLSIITLIFKL